jgi:ketosteroid isomerase-like protein
MRTQKESSLRYLGLVALLAAGTCVFTAAQNADTAKELVALESRYNHALVRADWKMLENIEADDLIFTNADGSVSHKSDLVSSLKSGDAKFESIAMSEVKVQSFGDVGVVTGRLIEKARYKASDISGDYRFTDVFAKHNGKWEHVTGQETLYKPEN